MTKSLVTSLKREKKIRAAFSCHSPISSLLLSLYQRKEIVLIFSFFILKNFHTVNQDNREFERLIESNDQNTTKSGTYGITFWIEIS